MSIPKRIREQVFAKYDGHCAYCGKELKYPDMQVDHIYPQYLGGKDDIENYNPACRMCNLRKGTMSIETFRNEIKLQSDRICKTFQARMSLAYGLITKTDTPVIFFFEKYGK